LLVNLLNIKRDQIETKIPDMGTKLYFSLSTLMETKQGVGVRLNWRRKKVWCVTDPNSIIGELRRQSSLKGRHGIESAKQKYRGNLSNS